MSMEIPSGLEAAAEGHMVVMNKQVDKLVEIARRRLAKPGATPTRVISRMSVEFMPRNKEQQMIIMQSLFVAIVRLAGRPVPQPAVAIVREEGVELIVDGDPFSRVALREMESRITGLGRHEAGRPAETAPPLTPVDPHDLGRVGELIQQTVISLGPCTEPIGTWPFQDADPRCGGCGEPIELVVGNADDVVKHVWQSEQPHEDPRAGEDV